MRTAALRESSIAIRNYAVCIDNTRLGRLPCKGSRCPRYFDIAARQAARMDIKDLRQRLRQFAVERDWEQFHSPKNLAMALSVEAAELLEHFQWLTQKESGSPNSVDRDAVAAEIADIQIYLVMLADRLNIDVDQAVDDKVNANAIKYPPNDSSLPRR